MTGDTTRETEVREHRGPFWTVRAGLSVAYAALGPVVAVLGLLDVVDTGLEGAAASLLVVGVLMTGAGLLMLSWELWTPRRIAADTTGVQVGVGRAARRTPWTDAQQVRAGHGPRLPSFLETVDGDLQMLPAGTTVAMLDRWRADLGAPAAAPLPGRRVWRASPDRSSRWLMVSQVPLLLNVVAVVSRHQVVPVLVAAVALLALTAYVTTRRPVTVTATAAGLQLPGRARSLLAWDDVVDVRRKGRFEEQAVLERRDGSLVEAPGGLDVEVLRGWQRDLAPG